MKTEGAFCSFVGGRWFGSGDGSGLWGRGKHNGDSDYWENFLRTK